MHIFTLNICEFFLGSESTVTSNMSHIALVCFPYVDTLKPESQVYTEEIQYIEWRACTLIYTMSNNSL